MLQAQIEAPQTTAENSVEQSEAGSRTATVWLAVAVALNLVTSWIILFDVIPWLRGPAPYPPEWDWPYVPLTAERLGTWFFLGASIVYPIVVAAIMHPRWLRWKSEKTRVRVAVILAIIFFLVLQVALASARKGHLLELIIYRVYNPPGNGYFMSAVRTEDIWATIHNYAAAMPNFPHHRPQTHPPGILLYYAGFNYVFERLPDFSRWFAPIARSWAPPERDWVLLADHYVAAAFFSGLVQWLLACLAPISIYALLTRLDRPRLSRLSTYALWGVMLLPLLPSVSSFYSHWDVNYLLIASAAWYFALRGQDRLHEGEIRGIGRWLDWLWAGLLLWLLTWLSFGNAVLCGMVGLHLLWREFITLRWRGMQLDWHSVKRFVAGAAILSAAVAVPWLLLYVFWDMNYFTMLRVGMQQHYLIVTEGRDFRIWWWMNLVDFALWVGPGVLLLGLVATLWLIGHLRRGALESNLAGMALIVWAVIVALDMSGTTRAEIGRLWIFLMPFPVMFALAYLRGYWQRVTLMGLLALTTWVMGFALRAV